MVRASVRDAGVAPADGTEASTKPIQATAGSSNPVASTMLQWHRIHVAVVLSSVLEQE